MKLDARSRFRFRLQSSTFVLLVLLIVGLLAWLSTRYSYQADWTANNRHTLSEASQKILAQMQEPVRMTAYATQDTELRGMIRALAERYQRHKADFSLEFVDPNQVPGEARERGIRADGESIVEYRGRSEHLTDLSETSLSQALQRLLRSREHWIVFLSGHGERDPLGQANHDYGNWGRYLEERGFSINHLNFADVAQVPDNTSVLVLAGPRLDLLPGEIELLNHYLDQGGNLLWLLDPGPWHGLEPLAGKLGISPVPGQPVDPLSSSRLLGVNKAHLMLLVSEYAPHPITENFLHRTLFPEAKALHAEPPGTWIAHTLFASHAKAWSETGPLDRPTLEFDPDTEADGPLDLAFALTRPMQSMDGEEREQRVVVVGDGDFLANSYLENGGNLDLGMRMLDWLAGDDDLMDIPARIGSDLKLDLSPAASTFIGLTFLIVLPLGLLGSGLLIWWQRRKQ